MERKERAKARAARQAAKQIISNPKAYRVSHRHQCPICGHNSYCCHDEINGITLCTREAQGAVYDDCFRPVQFKSFGFLHVRNLEDFIVAPVEYRRIPKPKKILSGLSALVDLAVRMAEHDHLSLEIAAKDLGIPQAVLKSLRIGYSSRFNRQNWTVPERDASGAVIGIQYRPWLDGMKLNQGARGLCYADTWRTVAIKSGWCFLPEGMTDTAAAMAMGLAAVGRPSCSGGVDLLADLLIGLPSSVRVVVIADRDGGPGVRGAVSTAETLSKRLGRPVDVFFPPNDAKDTRAWFNAQNPPLDNQEALLGLGMRFLSGLEAVEVIEAGKYKTPYGSGNGPVSLGYGSHEENRAYVCLEALMSNWDNASKFCPNSITMIGVKSCGDARVILPCGKRKDCVFCMNLWKKKQFRRFASHFETAGKLFFGVVDAFNYSAVLKDMRRKAQASGVPLAYCAIRDEAPPKDNEDSEENFYFSIFSNSPIFDDSEEVSLPDALELLAKAIEHSHADHLRPITASRSWGKLEQKKSEFQVIRGSVPSIEALDATAARWGKEFATETTYTDLGVSVRYHAEVFGPVGSIPDPQAVQDFFAEARRYDACGEEAAVEFHLAALERRTTPPPDLPVPPIGAGEHQHTWQEIQTLSGPVWSCSGCGQVEQPEEVLV